MPLLEVENLSVEFGTKELPFRAVDHVSFSIKKGEILGIVGESGSGKSVTSLAVMGLVSYPGRIIADELIFDGKDLQAMTKKEQSKILGKDIAMIFQDPITSLNPSFTVGWQIIEAIKIHQGGTKKENYNKALGLLEKVGIPDPKARMNAYPYELSGGMCQRIMIAIAIACNPRLLIADEPTTALDVTVQAQIMDLLESLQKENDLAMILITHDLAVVAQSAHRVVVMYAGQVMETGKTLDVFSAPKHPYTAALLEALPEKSVGQKRLKTISGVVPGQYNRPKGCLFHPRCAFADDKCIKEMPEITGNSDCQVRCFHPLNNKGESE